MSEDPNSLAGASGAGVPQDKPSEVREVRPILWDGDMRKDMKDMRALVVPAGEEDEDGDLDQILDPKDSSAVEPADSSGSVTNTDDPSSETLEKTVVQTVGKASTPAKVSKSGTRTS